LVIFIVFNFIIHYTNIVGYSTTQLFTMLFPSQFFIYDYTIYDYKAQPKLITQGVTFVQKVSSRTAPYG